jgi:hypothetical protein
MVSRPVPDKPVKQSVSVRVETRALSRSDCQNTPDLHLIKRLPKAFKSRLFLPPSLSHPGPETLLECEYEGHFFRGGLKKQGFNLE